MKLTVIKPGLLLLLAFHLLVPMDTNGRTNESNFDNFRLENLYVGAGFGFGRKAGPTGFSANFIMSNNWGISISSKHFTLRAADLPHDYFQGGQGILFGVPIGVKNEIPNDYMDVMSFMILKEFNTSTKKIRFGVEAGPALLNYQKGVFTSYTRQLYTDDNYQVAYRIHEAAGFSMRAKLEFPLGRMAGLELGVFTNLNKFRTLAGVELYFTFGMVRGELE